ncbi:hypothetical protein QVD17_06808 [Tagetes erecta]|uniref:Secreted protein n=1 Tax=Tagetes erecta TaxID=13708 RepID=A0AAD8PCF4_TARER|nr:hypothetical protein QVD17_06808 [Tagetes erecta]
MNGARQGFASAFCVFLGCICGDCTISSPHFTGADDSCNDDDGMKSDQPQNYKYVFSRCTMLGDGCVGCIRGALQVLSNGGH